MDHLTVESAAAVPAGPLGGNRLDLVEGLPMPLRLDQFGFEQAIALSIRALSNASPTDTIKAAMPPMFRFSAS
ncbi:hypothetical protein [Streptomyces sp. NPDC056061]|uniref:hypothetical protein n=1 Tax=Streptomyces sp. NPDC056061 TaxID=3345700 RepID=UPI0035E3A462